MMTASETGAPDPQADSPKRMSRFSSVDWGSVRGQFSLTGLDADAKGGGGGTSNGTSRSLDDAASDRYAPSGESGSSRSPGAPNGSSRFERKSIQRVGDINNLVVEGDGGGTSDAEGASDAAAARRGELWASVLSVAVVVASAAVIFTEIVLPGLDDARGEQGRLLEIAENVVTACGDHNVTNDSSECRQLCRDNMCCVVEGEGSCVDDKRRDTDCAVYAGCEVLLDEEVTLFVLAQQINHACSDSHIESEGEYECDYLCFDHLCCFVEGEWSCVDDESMNCAAYAGCEALVPEVTWDE